MDPEVVGPLLAKKIEEYERRVEAVRKVQRIALGFVAARRFAAARRAARLIARVGRGAVVRKGKDSEK